MHIQLETSDTYAIQAYDNTELTINEVTYRENIIVSGKGIVTEWPIESIKDLQNLSLEMLLQENPEIIIIGHTEARAFAPEASRDVFMQKKIGFESMSIGAACRTYNVLLSERRNVVLGIIWGED